MKRRAKILLGAVLILLLLLEALVLFQEDQEAEPVYPVSGYITADPSSYMRRDPDTSREPLRELKKGIEVTVLGEVTGQDVTGNTTWYEIMYNNMHGYVSSSFVRIQYELDLPPVMPSLGSEEFKQDLIAKGFPESYLGPLMDLHAAYPQWTFTPLHTNYSFDRAVKGEYRPGVNLVIANSPPEYKSKADADFNYYTNAWREYEQGWVGASADLIAFQMDPRNFLDEVQIFQFESQRYNPDLDYRHGLVSVINKTFMAASPIPYLDREGQSQNLDTDYASLLEEAGRVSGVSPYHLLSRIIQEVSPNGSHSVSGNYAEDVRGYYNFYNIGATGGGDPLYMGLITARDGISGYPDYKNAEMLFPWTDPAKAIQGGAIFIGKDYINVDQHTLYLQKWNLVSRYTRPFTHQYMGNVLAPEYEAINVYNAYQEMGALQESKEFLIPVFLDMPAATPSPTGGGNPNNWLKAIRVNGQIIPNFRPERYEYKLQISSASRGLAVDALPWSADSSVAGMGVYQLRPGPNEIILQVVANNGVSRNYRLYVEQSPVTANVDSNTLPKISSASYQISSLGYLYGADPLQGSNTATFLKGQYSSLPASYDLALLAADGQTAIERAGTGSLLQLRENGRAVNQFPLVILGDANGDGYIDLGDFQAMRDRVIQGQINAPTAYDLAMDINQDGLVNLMDLWALKNHVIQVAPIAQTLVE